MLEYPSDSLQSMAIGNDIVRNPTQAGDTLGLEVAKPNLRASDSAFSSLLVSSLVVPYDYAKKSKRMILQFLVVL